MDVPRLQAAIAVGHKLHSLFLNDILELLNLFALTLYCLDERVDVVASFFIPLTEASKLLLCLDS